MSESIRTRVLAIALLATLAACGGGGGGGDSDQGAGGTPPVPPPAPPPPATFNVLAGGWSGSAAAGESAQVFVLADGTAWTFVKAANQGPLDMYVGTLVLANGQLSSTGMRAFDYETLGASGATANGTYVVGSQMNFAITRDGASVGVPIAVSAVASTDYNHGRAAALAEIAGAWGGAFRTTETGVLAISDSGVIQNFTTSNGCSGLGALAPRSYENVFDVALTLGGPPCASSGTTATGTAFVVGSGASARLYLGVKNADGTSGATFIGGR